MDSSSKKPCNSRDSPKKPATLPRSIMSTSKRQTQVTITGILSRKANLKCKNQIEKSNNQLYQSENELSEHTVQIVSLSQENVTSDGLEVSSLHNNPCDQLQLADVSKFQSNNTENSKEHSDREIASEHSEDQVHIFGKPVSKVNAHIPHTITSKMDRKKICLSLKHSKVLNENSTMTSLVNNENDLTNSNTSSDSSPSQSQDYAIDAEMKSSNNFTISEFDPLHVRNPSSKFIGVSNRQILDTIIIEDSNGSENDIPCNVSKQICIRDQNIISPALEDEIIIGNKSEHLVWQTSEQHGSKTECLRFQFTQNVECRSPSDASETTISQTSVVDNAMARSTPQSEILDIVNFSRQGSEIQICEPIQPSTSKPKSSTMSKFKKFFGVHSEPNLKPLQKPDINIYGPNFNGILTWIADDNLICTSKLLYCALAEEKLFCYADSAMQVLKEVYKLNNVTSLQIVLPVECGNCLYCFELGISNPESSGVKQGSRLKITFGCPTAAERLTWAQKIAVNLTSAFPFIDYSEFTRLGWCYLKVGVSGEWLAAWLLVAGRELMYYCTEDVADNVDLRKTRCLGNQAADEESKKACPSDCCSNLFLDCSVATLYLRFPHTEEFQNWNSVIRLAAHSNGLGLDEQQLTNEDIPTIVDKCINFIYAYGVLSEGIYRRAGSSVVLAELLTRFRVDAWSVQLTPQIYSEHDVAGVFKRFFRDLPTPLISRECQSRLINASAMENESRRLEEYQCAIANMSLVSSNTTRKLFAHLNFIHKWSAVNKMTAENLAAVWAPTIMPPTVKTTGQQILWSETEVNIVRDIIVNYGVVWRLDEDEVKRDLACHLVTMRMQESACPIPQPSSAGNLRFWVFMEDTSTHFQVSLTPDKTSAHVCAELSRKTNIPQHKLMLEEQICNGSMKRIVHKDEIVLDVVTRWGYWDDEDRKDNNLVIKENRILYQMNNLLNNGTPVCGQLRFANDTTKNFKSYVFEVNSFKLSGYADAQGSSIVEEWNINNIIWYFGHETKRDPQCRWAITFIPKNKNRRSKEHPFFGSTIAGGVTESQLRWATALMFAQHDTILTPPQGLRFLAIDDESISY